MMLTYYLYAFGLVFVLVADSVLPPFGGREDAMSEERIAHILNEASTLMKNSTPSSVLQQQHQLKDEQQHQHQSQSQPQPQPPRHSISSSVQEDSRSNEDFKSPPLHSCSSPLFKEQTKTSPAETTIGGQAQANAGHLRSEDINPEKMARLYQEIMARAPREAFSK